MVGLVTRTTRLAPVLRVTHTMAVATVFLTLRGTTALIAQVTDSQTVLVLRNITVTVVEVIFVELTVGTIVTAVSTSSKCAMINR